MAMSQSDLSRLIESLRSNDGLELVRSVAERVLQRLIEAEATAAIGAAWNEHTDARMALRIFSIPASTSTWSTTAWIGYRGRRSGV